MAPKRQETGRDSLAALITQLHLLGGTASRATLTERLGCGRSVMGFLLTELTDRGVVTVDRAARPSNGQDTGRPSHRVSIAPEAPVVIAVQINVDTATVATVALGGRVLRSSTISLQRRIAVETLLDRICSLAAEQSRAHPRLLAIGVSVPSPVRRRDGYAFAPLHLGWGALPLREMLTERMARVPGLAELPLAIGNDANLAGLAEYHHGAGRDATQMLYLTTADIGLGGGLISNGQLFDGAHGYAMEPGHITVDPAGAPCPCGSTGCLEIEADHRGLLRASGRATVPDHEIAHSADLLLQAATRGEEAAMLAVRHVAARLGNGLASLTNLTDPDRIVLGGSLARYRQLAADTIAESLTARSFLSHADPALVLEGTLTAPALLGAADLAFQPLLDDPRLTLDRL
ncbi:ROK family protein [Nocardia sp. CDC160]|uniref:ROK family protein n=1 Tax=Nocardia sp. CDC160 TaxID=3112166 RepID=UPI002DB64FB5|nr:ROK family protein [Nocardia sp. CDC160]MEC3917901.1 ROK family protein [Nocardia sp. CDC160]